MARKGLPKKYAKMGFKKGWAAYKKTKRRPATRTRTTTRRRNTRGKRKMARRRKTYRRYSRRASGFNPIIKGIIAGAGASLIKKYVNIPFADDLAVLGVGYFMKDNTLKTIGAVGIGSDIVSGMGGTNGGGGYIG